MLGRAGFGRSTAQMAAAETWPERWGSPSSWISTSGVKGIAMTDEQRFETALRDDRFELRYEAQVDAAGRVVAVEAICYWLHPERGSIEPSGYLDMAEATGLIVPFGRWLLKAVCAQLAEWMQSDRTRHLIVATNVSLLELGESDFVPHVRKLMTRFAINPSRLTMELAETQPGDGEVTAARLRSLQDLGIRLSLDNFGRGYSTLGYRAMVRVSEVKINQRFFLPPAATLDLVRTLQMETVALGVEEVAQREYLRSCNYDRLQGPLFGGPLAPDDIGEMLGKVL